MKKVLLALLLVLPTAAKAEPSALMCLFEPLKLRFNLVNKNGIDLIQWEGNPFTAVVLTVDDQYLTVRQYANTATFKALIDIKTLSGYGAAHLFSGEDVDGKIICATD